MSNIIKPLREIVADNDVSSLENQLNHSEMRLGYFGARKVLVKLQDNNGKTVEKEMTLNQLIKSFEKIVCNKNANVDPEKAKMIFDKIRSYRQMTLQSIENSPKIFLTRFFTMIVRPFRKIPNLFFNREKHMASLQKEVNSKYYLEQSEKSYSEFSKSYSNGLMPNYYKGEMSETQAAQLQSNIAPEKDRKPFLFRNTSCYNILTLWDNGHNYVILNNKDDFQLKTWISKNEIGADVNFLPPIFYAREGEDVPKAMSLILGDNVLSDKHNTARALSSLPDELKAKTT